MPADHKYKYAITISVPGKRATTKHVDDKTKVIRDAAKLPVGTTIWVTIPWMKIGYGLEVHKGGWLY